VKCERLFAVKAIPARIASVVNPKSQPSLGLQSVPVTVEVSPMSAALDDAERTSTIMLYVYFVMDSNCVPDMFAESVNDTLPAEGV